MYPLELCGMSGGRARAGGTREHCSPTYNHILVILVQVRGVIGSFVAVVQHCFDMPYCDVKGGMVGLISSDTISVCCPGRRTSYYCRNTA